jgi:hypothetical protein
MQPFGLGDAAALGSSDMHQGSSFLAGPKSTIAYDPLAVTSIHLSLLPSRCLISYNSDLQLTVHNCVHVPDSMFQSIYCTAIAM